MVHDEALAARFRAGVEGIAGLSERRMMGGLCFFVNGHMIGGTDRAKSGAGRFMFRVGKGNQALADRLTGGEPVIQGGRRMSGFYFVDAAACDAAVLRDWLSLALRHAAGLPPK
ncbi:MAG: TfoX/Sxy family protein [Sneathiellaceae bacterium]